MTAKVDLSPQKVRRLPMLTGTISFISAAAIEDVRTGQSYFLARINLDSEEIPNRVCILLAVEPMQYDLVPHMRVACRLIQGIFKPAP